MIRRVLVLVLIGLLADTAAASAQDHRCLTGGRNDGIHLLWRWLDNGSADVQYAGQRGRDSTAVERLITIVRGEEDQHLRSRAIFWLGQTRSARAAEVLREIINRD